MCDYCLNETKIKNEGDFCDDCELRINSYDKEIVFVFDDGEKNTYAQWARIYFCPMCGRWL